MAVWLTIAVLTVAIGYVAFALDRTMRQQTAWNRATAAIVASLESEVTILRGALPLRGTCEHHDGSVYRYGDTHPLVSAGPPQACPCNTTPRATGGR